jgi:hypothetical protein
VPLPRLRGDHLQAHRLAEGSREAIHALELQEVPTEGSAGWGEIWKWGAEVSEPRPKTVEDWLLRDQRRIMAVHVVTQAACPLLCFRVQLMDSWMGEVHEAVATTRNGAEARAFHHLLVSRFPEGLSAQEWAERCIREAAE